MEAVMQMSMQRYECLRLSSNKSLTGSRRLASLPVLTTQLLPSAALLILELRLWSHIYNISYDEVPL